MGDIKKVLAMGELPYRSVTPRGIWSDLSENAHLHMRNVRMEFSEDEFARYRNAVHSLGMAMEKHAEATDYREGDCNGGTTFNWHGGLKEDSDYYPNRCTIELGRDNTVHFHYRDLRLHLSLDEFTQIAGLFSESIRMLYRPGDFPVSDVSKPTRVTVPIDRVQPYDAGHKPMADDKEHRLGIDYMKSLIANGERLRPILVAPNGQRLDGYKRYMAQLELGQKEIEVIVDPNGRMGGQAGQSAIDDEDSIYTAEGTNYD